jgi:hypothetical protein
MWLHGLVALGTGLILAGCTATAPVATANAASSSVPVFDAPGTAPAIHAFTFTPQSLAKGASLALAVDASSPAGRTLSYAWSASRGTLDTTSGSTAHWKAQEADGSLKPGLATISVTVADSGGANTPTALMTIAADGTAQYSGGTSKAYTPSAQAGATAAAAIPVAE